MNKLQMKVMLLAGLGALALLPPAKADQRNQKTVFTFSGPVEIPGQTLPAGTYVFTLANSHSSRNVVQVFSKDETRVLSTFLAIRSHRLHASDETIVRFEERAAGSPQAIKAWFYPGKTYGHEFVYPKIEALALAKVNNSPVPSMPTELIADTTKPTVTLDGPEVMALNLAPLKAEEPNGEEVDLASLFVVADPPAFAPRGEPSEQLPTTATSLPLVGLIGLLSMGGAITLRLNAAKRSDPSAR